MSSAVRGKANRLKGPSGRGTGLSVSIPVNAATLDGFRAWAISDDFPQRGRISFINREVLVDMSPEEVSTHNKIKTAVTITLGHLCSELQVGDYFSDRVLVTNKAAELSTEPDGTIVLWKSVKSGRVRLVPRAKHEDECVELEGTPDLVIEIVSRSSLRKDTQKLRRAYHQAGIPEYWLINALGKRIDFQILAHRPASYVATTSRGAWRRSEVFSRAFRLRRRRNPIGIWDYTLDVRSP